MKRFILNKDSETSYDLLDLKLGCSWTVEELAHLRKDLGAVIDEKLLNKPKPLYVRVGKKLLDIFRR